MPVPPARLAALIGDCVHNLRSALDHLATYLLEANGARPSPGTHFPIALTQDVFAHTISAFAPLPQQARDTLLAVQPFQLGSESADAHELWVLHQL
ncbi:MAG: hypothetical protein M0005_17365 [Actinomycetota bacterium]|nr:hypothetical protein [Actinomycetota bacterium]